MGSDLKYGSLFSGIAGFDSGFDAAGFDVLWQCEIEPSCITAGRAGPILNTRKASPTRFVTHRRHELPQCDWWRVWGPQIDTEEV